jgi:cysteinyl-tRNA synthetase
MIMELKLYNTLTKRKETLKPLAINPATGKPLARMYVCGPTVYDFAHIGNARPVIVFDVLFRLLRHIYGAENVFYTRNITDVDDKINARAMRDFPGLPINEAIRRVTEGTNNQFQADVKALGNLEPTHQPRATEHIEGMVEIIRQLIAKGYAYVAKGDEGREVLFSVGAMPGYGQLSKRRLDEQIEGARVAVEAHKRNAADFVLWKESAADQPGWAASFPSDGGEVSIFGRPGWHIECSAMSMAKLLEPFGGGLSCDDPVKNTFDIHGGGIDLVFPHHENEIAQSCCAFGAPGAPNPLMASIWMHNGFLQVEGQKMSKSLGNFRTIREVLNDFPEQGDVPRLAMLMTHYVQPIDWTKGKLNEATILLDKWETQIYQAKNLDGPEEFDQSAQPPQDFVEALCDDLNTPRAITLLHGLSRRITDATIGTEKVQHASELLAALRLIGLDFELTIDPDPLIDEARVQSLISARLAARAAKNWAESDRIRDELAAMGIQLKDGKDAEGKPTTTWEVKR